jgi:hypothetical protein
MASGRRVGQGLREGRFDHVLDAIRNAGT